MNACRHVVIGFALLACITACGDEASPPTTHAPLATRVTAPVGGVVTLRSGSCPYDCHLGPLVAEVAVFPVIPLDESDVRTPPPGATPTATATTDANGRFSFVLPEGRYSILVNYESTWYPLEFGQGDWSPVEVNHEWLEDVKLTINQALE